jgi:hypothetical protein
MNEKTTIQKLLSNIYIDVINNEQRGLSGYTGYGPRVYCGPTTGITRRRTTLLKAGGQLRLQITEYRHMRSLLLTQHHWSMLRYQNPLGCR